MGSYDDIIQTLAAERDRCGKMVSDGNPLSSVLMAVCVEADDILANYFDQPIIGNKINDATLIHILDLITELKFYK